jgi:chromosome partitioning protein
MQFDNAHDLVQHVAQLFQQNGWQITTPAADIRSYDLEASKEGHVLAIQVKNYKSPARVPQLEQFIDFFEQPIADRFTHGVFVTTNGYSRHALTLFAEMDHPHLKLLVLDDQGRLQVVDPEAALAAHPPQPLTYMGVFTSKGGVGKTTISAHLAGALAISGYDVALVDLDPEKNLSTLLGEGVQLPGRRGNVGNTVTVYNRDTWDDVHPPEKIRMVVCDCSPVFHENPEEIIAKFSYCLIPTTLNPLGLNKNGYVINRTIEQIRAVNPNAYLFVFINNYMPDDSVRTEILKQRYHEFFADIARQDHRFKFIDPEDVAIRNSKQLFYWGYHIYSGDRHQLAFNPVGGRCHPKADFLNLLEYLENHSKIAKLKSHA